MLSRAIGTYRGSQSTSRVDLERKLTKFTEATIVVGTFYLTAFRVSVETLLSSRAEAILGEPPAFWHTA
jgi:hypothetical protein